MILRIFHVYKPPLLVLSPSILLAFFSRIAQPAHPLIVPKRQRWPAMRFAVMPALWQCRSVLSCRLPPFFFGQIEPYDGSSLPERMGQPVTLTCA